MNELTNKVEINTKDCQVIEVEPNRFELFKPIEGYDKYMISTTGTVISLHYGKMKVRKPKKDKDNYLQITLTDNSTKSGIKTYQVHRLVAQTFLPNWDAKLEVDHLDGCRWNNSIDNLQLVTHQQNMSNQNKKRKKYTRLNEVQKELIKMLYVPKHDVYGFSNLARHFDISPQTLKTILYK